jgi:hypothetical protein
VKNLNHEGAESVGRQVELIEAGQIGDAGGGRDGISRSRWGAACNECLHQKQGDDRPSHTEDLAHQASVPRMTMGLT